jgi:hypothetical protein
VGWIPVVAWIAAFVLAVVVLGSCAYELHWKTRRLHTELRRVQESTDELTRIQARAAVLAQDVARLRAGFSPR